jgi:hypothetical protein
MPKPRALAVLLFDDVEVLDCCGPFEVFSAVGRGSPGWAKALSRALARREESRSR